MHLADRIELTDGLVARPYCGRRDHPAMARLLTDYRRAKGNPEHVTAEQIDRTYADLTDCDPDLDIAMIDTGTDTDTGGELVGYCRPARRSTSAGSHDLVVFAPIRADLHSQDLFDRVISAEEDHLRDWAGTGAADRYVGYAGHPGPGREATGEAAWFEARGYTAEHWGASLRRPDLDDVACHELPDGIELRAVEPDQMHEIVLAHNRCFVDDWDYDPEQAENTSFIIDNPYRDESLWQVAWDGDLVVGQVKPFINTVENDERGYRRGYAEYISTHADYRNRGIARALLARALVALRERGMTEAVLGVDTDNPGGAFQLYRSLGFELESYEAVYAKPLRPALHP